jgi:hypothetical protein
MVLEGGRNGRLLFFDEPEYPRGVLRLSSIPASGKLQVSLLPGSLACVMTLQAAPSIHAAGNAKRSARRNYLF